MNFDTVAYIANELNKNSIKWAVGASVMLHFHGLAASPNDMDILVDENDISKARDVLNNIGELLYDGSNDHTEVYLTQYFYKYRIKDVQMDVMSGFTLKHSEGIYKFNLDDRAIVSHEDLQGVKLPLTSLEDWYILYQLMPDREPKVRMIEDYLKSKGIRNKQLLERALVKELPESIRARINSMF